VDVAVSSSSGLRSVAVGSVVGEKMAVALGSGWSVSVTGARGVEVGMAGSTRVLAGVAIPAGFPGAHRIISNPTRPEPIRKNQAHHCLFIAKCQTLHGLSTLFQTHHIILENRTGYKQSKRMRITGMGLDQIDLVAIHCSHAVRISRAAPCCVSSTDVGERNSGMPLALTTRIVL
jgi:hypothetical protein